MKHKTAHTHTPPPPSPPSPTQPPPPLWIKVQLIFHHLTVAEVSFCGLKRGITPKIRMLCFVLINCVPSNLSCVWNVFGNSSSHFCFRFFFCLSFLSLMARSAAMKKKKRKMRKERKQHSPAVDVTVVTKKPDEESKRSQKSGILCRK